LTKEKVSAVVASITWKIIACLGEYKKPPEL